MKKVLLMMAFAGLMFAANAQGEKKEMAKSDKKEMKGKEHVCTAACTKEKHVYAHGEKGHVCTEACKKKM